VGELSSKKKKEILKIIKKKTSFSLYNQDRGKEKIPTQMKKKAEKEDNLIPCLFEGKTVQKGRKSGTESNPLYDRVGKRKNVHGLRSYTLAVSSGKKYRHGWYQAGREPADSEKVSLYGQEWSDSTE